MVEMPRIASFSVDHNLLQPGLYLSRHDRDVMTYDLRMKKPNVDRVMSTGSVHTLEHIVATYLRAYDTRQQIIYFGPMGCRTGFYLLVFADLSAEKVRESLLAAFIYAAEFSGAVPGASAAECGNFTDMDLDAARFDAANYVKVLQGLTGERWFKY
ncbi:MAG: S-ribosylhomocysteine lyase [Bacillota bacterium]|jgi:S-ribosylhomocysteine lyase